MTKTKTFHTCGRLTGLLRMPGDKSMSHRAIILAALSPEPVWVSGLSPGGDVRNTLECVRRLGAQVGQWDTTRQGVRLGQMRNNLPAEPVNLWCGNSKTTLSLLTGLVAGLPGVKAVLDGDASLRGRPTDLLRKHLTRMGGVVEDTDGHPPVQVTGRSLEGGHGHNLSDPSSQLKGAILLAGLNASKPTHVTTPHPTRETSERLLHKAYAKINWGPTDASIRYSPNFQLPDIHIPGDLSAAAFWVVAAMLTPRSDLTLTDLDTDDYRATYLQVLQGMGADIQQHNNRVRVKYSPELRGSGLTAAQSTACIDELPVMSLAAACAIGTSYWQGVKALKTKESDRLAWIQHLLDCLGVATQYFPEDDVLKIVPPNNTQTRKHLTFNPAGDHRFAMTLAVAGTAGLADIQVKDFEGTTASSYPTFLDDLAVTLRQPPLTAY